MICGKINAISSNLIVNLENEIKNVLIAFLCHRSSFIFMSSISLLKAIVIICHFENIFYKIHKSRFPLLTQLRFTLIKQTVTNNLSINNCLKTRTLSFISIIAVIINFNAFVCLDFNFIFKLCVKV